MELPTQVPSNHPHHPLGFGEWCTGWVFVQRTSGACDYLWEEMGATAFPSNPVQVPDFFCKTLEKGQCDNQDGKGMWGEAPRPRENALWCVRRHQCLL